MDGQMDREGRWEGCGDFLTRTMIWHPLCGHTFHFLFIVCTLSLQSMIDVSFLFLAQSRNSYMQISKLKELIHFPESQKSQEDLGAYGGRCCHQGRHIIVSQRGPSRTFGDFEALEMSLCPWDSVSFCKVRDLDEAAHTGLSGLAF